MNRDFVDFIKSPAVTIVLATLCLAFIMKQAPDFIKSLKEPKDSIADKLS